MPLACTRGPRTSPHRSWGTFQPGFGARLVLGVLLIFCVLGGVATGGAADVAQTRAPAGPVVVIGVPSLQWSDVDRHNTPALWRLTEQGSGGGLSIRATKTTTCPADGWLTVSAGQRARLPHGNCALPPNPATASGGATAADWGSIKKDNAGTAFEARVGLLGDTVRRGGGCTMAVGPGAVFGAADGAGRVDAYAPSADKVPSGGWSRCALSMVDVDDIFRAYLTAGVDAQGAQAPVSQASRAAAARAADQQISRVLAALPGNATVLLAGLSDTVINIPHLHVALATSPKSGGAGAYGNAYLTANSTRQPGLVTLTDLTATVLARLGLKQPEAAVGSAWRAAPTRATAAEKVSALDDEEVAAQAIRRLQPAFFIVLFGGQLLLYGIAAVALRRRWGRPAARADDGTPSGDDDGDDGREGQRKEPGDADDGGARRRRILAGTRLIALMGAAAPVASFLANLVPWWRSAHPAPALALSVLGAITVVTALALAGPWRRSVIGPGLVIAAVTALVLGGDALTGSHLQLNAIMGYTALVAGRFYGFGNQAFALFAVAAILTAGWLAERYLVAHRRTAAVVTVVTVGAIAIAIDGWPAWGSDFGGVIAMVPALAVLALMISGRPVSLPRILLFCLAGAVIVLAISLIDSLRAEPSHLGRFWDDLINGEAWGVIGRKFGAMLRSLGYWPFTVAVVGALCFLFFVLARPLQWRAALLDRAYHHSVTLRPVLTSALVLAIAGMLVNDSGVVIPAIAVSLAIPLTLAASVRAWELDGEPAATSPPARSRPESATTG